MRIIRAIYVFAFVAESACSHIRVSPGGQVSAGSDDALQRLTSRQTFGKRSVLLRRQSKKPDPLEEKLKLERSKQSKTQTGGKGSVISPASNQQSGPRQQKNAAASAPLGSTGSKGQLNRGITGGGMASGTPRSQTAPLAKARSMPNVPGRQSQPSPARPLPNVSRNQLQSKGVPGSIRSAKAGKQPGRNKLCRRGEDIQLCDMSDKRKSTDRGDPNQASSSQGASSPTPVDPSNIASSSRQLSFSKDPSSSRQHSFSKDANPSRRPSTSDHATSALLQPGHAHQDPNNPMAAPPTQLITDRRAERSLEVKKARMLSKDNKLTTGILATQLASGITGTSATFAGACCPTAMACGSHVIPCSAVATSSLGGAGICLGLVGGCLIAKKAYDDHQNNKAREAKIEEAYHISRETRDGQRQLSRTLSDARRENKAEFDRTKGRMSEETKERVRIDGVVTKTREDISAVEKKALERAQSVENKAMTRAGSVEKKALDRAGSVEKKADSALTRADSIEKKLPQVTALQQTADRAHTQAVEAKIGQMKTEKSVSDLKNIALTAEKKADETSMSVGSLQRSHSERLGQMEAELKAMRIHMAQNYGSGYTGMR